MAPPVCFDAADSNDDGELDITDGIFALNWLFSTGRPLPPPGPETCGLDLKEDSLPECDYPLSVCAF